MATYCARCCVAEKPVRTVGSVIPRLNNQLLRALRLAIDPDDHGETPNSCWSKITAGERG